MKSEVEYSGLSESEVLASRERYGENILTPPARTPMWKLFLEKFSDPIIRILLVALLLSVAVAVYHIATGEAGMSALFEPAGIALAILLATVVGFLFEMSAAKKFDILNQVNDDLPVKVIRGGHMLEIPKREIVVGDIVMLNAGDEIPADGILLSAVSVQVNESSLTGEPMATKTTIEADFDKEATYPSNAVMNGSTMLGGYGVMQVTQVGDATEYGKVYTGSQIENNTQTPLDKQLNTLASFITKASYVIAAVIFIARTVIYLTEHPVIDWLLFGSYLLSTAMIAVTVIVVAVPEGLPMSVTLSLAMSMKRMLANNNLVRKMHACETMGAASVICTDKTGTLTQNQMRVHEAAFDYIPESGVEDIIFESIAANSTAHLDKAAGSVKVLGNPTEGALLLWLADRGVDYAALRRHAEVIEQLTFSTERKYMATVVQSPLLNHRVLYVKGAPEYVMNFCSDRVTSSGNVPMADSRPMLEEKLLQYQNQAMRTLGFAYQVIEDNESHFKDGRLYNTELTFLGIVAISDPIRPDVPDAVKRCFDAGIQVKMVTGDTPGTAKEIGRQIGLWTEKDTDRNVITGVEFAQLTDKEALDRVLDLKIMSRARPMDKQRLVQLLQQKQAIVAVTGDGTNDAPALNHAHVGLSMGSGTSVAKEASDITLLDDSFSSITSAVMWGRSVYQNIQRFILFQLTINVAALIIVLLGSLFGSELPITVTQMLWVNLIMDTFSAGALASLPPSPEVMKRKPRNSNAFIIVPQMQRLILATGITFVVILLGLLYVLSNYAGGIEAGTPEGLRNLTIFFTVFVMLQFWNMFNAKTFGTNDSAFKNIFKSEGFLTVGMAIIVGQILVVNFGGSVFRTIPLTWSEWIWITLATSLVGW